MMSNRVARLSTAEWRLFLLSDCIKNWKEIYQCNEVRFYVGDRHLAFGLTREETVEFNNRFTSYDDADKIREQMKKEWRFTGTVIDNGRGVYTKCEYCAEQDIRYKYVIVNSNNGIMLHVGCMCVGRIIQDMSPEFLASLTGLRQKAIKEDRETLSYIKIRRQQQRDRICEPLKLLKARGYAEDDFFKSLKYKWSTGRNLSDIQEKRLLEFSSQVEKYNTHYINTGSCKFNNMLARISYQKVLKTLEDRPDNEYLKACKFSIERYGCLTDKMYIALLGKKYGDSCVG